MDLAPDERRGEAVSLVTLASYLGLTIGPVAGDLIRGDGRYTAVWLVAAALALAATLVVATLRETKPETQEAAAQGWLPPRGALRPGLLVLVGLLGFGGFVAFAAIYARDLGIEPAGARLRPLRRGDLARPLLRPAPPGHARARGARSSSPSSASRSASR